MKQFVEYFKWEERTRKANQNMKSNLRLTYEENDQHTTSMCNIVAVIVN